MATKIKESEGKDMTRPLVYRYIKALEEERFIDVDRSSYRHQYHSDYKTLLAAVESKRKSAFDHITYRERTIKTEIAALQEINTTGLARRLREVLSGKKITDHTRAVEGWDDVRHLIDDVIYNRARSGDTVRLTLDWVGQEALTEKRRQGILASLGGKDITFKLLYHQQPTEFAVKFLNGGSPSGGGKWNVDLRMFPRSQKTYQLIALNKYGLVLILSFSPLTAIWIPRTENPLLVDDAINSFDSEFESGKSLFEEE